MQTILLRDAPSDEQTQSSGNCLLYLEVVWSNAELEERFCVAKDGGT